MESTIKSAVNDILHFLCSNNTQNFQLTDPTPQATKEVAEILQRNFTQPPPSQTKHLMMTPNFQGCRIKNQHQAPLLRVMKPEEMQS